MASREEERWAKASAMACEAIDECRIQLMFKFRFLDLALWKMPLMPLEARGRYPLATDARNVYLDPYSVLARFGDSFEEAVRDYLHLVLHCIFRHPFDEAHPQHPAWWLACDVIAESVALDICDRRFPSEDDDRRRELIAELRMKVGMLTPGRLYEAFRLAMGSPQGDSQAEWTQRHLVEMQALFERDDHEGWPGYAKADKGKKPDIEFLGADSVHTVRDEQRSEAPDTSRDAGGGEGEESDEVPELEQGEDGSGQEDGDGPEQTAAQDADAADPDGKDESDEAGGDGKTDQAILVPAQEADDERPDGHDDEDREAWERIGEQIEMDLETFSREWGDEANGLVASLRAANRKVYDYSEFLRRFSVLTEDMKVNDDEYDYIFYTYGMDLYGNMPLVEPLEYAEVDRVREFVIAIDTSESVRGSLVKRFVEHTFEILRESEGFGSEVDIHIIQCDARVQSDTRITDLRQIGPMLDDFVVSGFGGTDFRPVFDYVDGLRDEGELPNLKGLVYFTDGKGTFPSSPPDYDTAFVFMDDGAGNAPQVPPWAMKVVISEEEIGRLR